jgi:hypothetical protein
MRLWLDEMFYPSTKYILYISMTLALIPTWTFFKCPAKRKVLNAGPHAKKDFR